MQKRVLVVGGKLSGHAAFDFLKKRGVSVDLLDDSGAGFSDLSLYDLLVLSPGIPPEAAIVLEAKRLGVKMIGEPELGLGALKNRMIGVTGSNGKTTTVMLVAFVLNFYGKNARAIGNVGLPACAYEGPCDEILVVELSSFQLTVLQGGFFEVACILNITPDHLDWHGSFDEYAKAKWRIKECLKEGGKFIGPGLSNEEAALEICGYFGVSKEAFLTASSKFEPPPHRREFVAEIDGVGFYNDSKATTPESVIYAVERINKPIILIAGGLDKGLSFEKWPAAFTGKVKKIILIGSSACKIRQTLVNFAVAEANDLNEAADAAFAAAAKGDCVLLSPGCASFDQFQNYKHRGEVFKAAALRLLKASATREMGCESKRYDTDIRVR